MSYATVYYATSAVTLGILTIVGKSAFSHPTNQLGPFGHTVQIDFCFSDHPTAELLTGTVDPAAFMYVLRQDSTKLKPSLTHFSVVWRCIQLKYLLLSQ